MSSKSDNYSIAIPKQALAEMPPVDFHERITLVDTPEKLRKAVAFLNDRSIVGFDTETRPNFRKGQNHQVSLIQIATDTISFLFRINHTGFMNELREFLENPGITKIGLSLKDDFHNLRKIIEFEPQGFIELQDMVHNYRITDASLQKIYGILFGQRISKGQRLTNWEALELTPAQQQYAALDAWACLHIYRHLTAGNFNPEESIFKVYPEPSEI